MVWYKPEAVSNPEADRQPVVEVVGILLHVVVADDILIRLPAVDAVRGDGAQVDVSPAVADSVVIWVAEVLDAMDV